MDITYASDGKIVGGNDISIVITNLANFHPYIVSSVGAILEKNRSYEREIVKIFSVESGQENLHLRVIMSKPNASVAEVAVKYNLRSYDGSDITEVSSFNKKYTNKDDLEYDLSVIISYLLNDNQVYMTSISLDEEEPVDETTIDETAE